VNFLVGELGNKLQPKLKDKCSNTPSGQLPKFIVTVRNKNDVE
jgi:hypothetical protein